eukprot:COSAG01_NODE_12230_length_1777_cov_1.056615_3_plen_223_part_01
MAAPGTATADAGPSGLLVVNDVNRARAMTIAHRSRRGTPRTPLLPSLYRRAYKLRYQRILCDVPCSGDGTLRKNRSMWSKWDVRDGLALHQLQLAILRRGVELLAPGGKLVYSTCTLNPIEGEAVVAAALRHFGVERLRLLPPPAAACIGGDGFCDGQRSWWVPAADGTTPGRLYRTWAEVPSDQRRKRKGAPPLCRSMFPPGCDDEDGATGATAASCSDGGG